MAVFSNSTGARAKPILSIRGRLVILALLAVVPLMLDRVRVLEASRVERIEAAAGEALDLARHGAQGQAEIMTTTRAMLQVMARAYVSMLARGETCNLYLKDLAGNLPWIKGLAVIGSDARIKCGTVASAIGLDVSDRPHYLEALRLRDFVVSNYVVGHATRSPAILAAYPTQAIDPEVNAVIVASVDLQWLSTLVATLERRPGSTVLLIDGNGTLLTGDTSVADRFGTSMKDWPLMAGIAGRGEGMARGEGLDGIRRVFGFLRVPLTNAYLAVGLDESDVAERIDREIRLSYLQLGFFGLLVLMIAWFGGERLIVDPIRSLARTATRIGRGELDVRTNRESWAQEFEPLADALNDMADKLDARERELRAANRHLEELASIDSLCALANRRGFDARLAHDWQHAAKRMEPLALLMVDVDYFKQFNDTYGHVEGDNCLRSLGEILATIATGDDLPARYGGEEFALLLPGASLDKAIEIADRLRWAVEILGIVNDDAPTGIVTVSIGVAALVPREAGRPQDLVEAADAALYDAKRAGRNKVRVYSPAALAAAS